MAKPAEKRAGNLGQQIQLARKGLSEWPTWMKEAARFEGTAQGGLKTIIRSSTQPKAKR